MVFSTSSVRCCCAHCQCQASGGHRPGAGSTVFCGLDALSLRLRLPPGWTLENGFLALEDKLIRKHYLPRDTLFDPSDQAAGCPLPLHYLSKVDRITRAAGHKETYDRWKQQGGKATAQTWTGQTVFKILPAFRLLAMDTVYNISGGHASYLEPAKARKDQLSERHMRLADRLASWKPNAKSLKASSKMMFGRWCQKNGSIPADRILKAHALHPQMVQVAEW